MAVYLAVGIMTDVTSVICVVLFHLALRKVRSEKILLALALVLCPCSFLAAQTGMSALMVGMWVLDLGVLEVMLGPETLPA